MIVLVKSLVQFHVDLCCRRRLGFSCHCCCWIYPLPGPNPALSWPPSMVHSPPPPPPSPPCSTAPAHVLLSPRSLSSLPYLSGWPAFLWWVREGSDFVTGTPAVHNFERCQRVFYDCCKAVTASGTFLWQLAPIGLGRYFNKLPLEWALMTICFSPPWPCILLLMMITDIGLVLFFYLNVHHQSAWHWWSFPWKYVIPFMM